jgi:type I restriction enzyme, R subunit
MTPEEKARVKIDQWFAEAGWKVVDRDEYEPTITAAAIREGLLKGNLEADYFLFINGKAVGVLEAKREEVDISTSKVSEQVVNYAKSVPSCYPTWQKPLAMLYKSNGTQIEFLDFRKHGTTDWQTIGRIHTPKEIAGMLGMKDPFSGLPTLSRKGLRDCQFEAVTELEKSFRSGQNRALMVLATGAGKTYTACLTAYRMLSYTPMRRILFLVDRNNLARQAETEFGTFRLTETGDAFSTIFAVNRLKSATVPSDSNVVICTIQRLFSLLRGEEITDTDDDDEDTADAEVTLPDNPKLPHDFFDLIIIDECHRSIYGNWRCVLEYFDTSRLVGLTATPIPDTMAFFNNNRVVNYTLEQSIIDGVNVDSRVYRIKTKVTEEGGAIMQGQQTKVETRYTGEVKTVSAKETRQYTRDELNRSIINPAQIKLILSTYRDAVYTEMFCEPQREANFCWLPKTLIFALNENHATNIVNIAREVFAEVCPGADMERYVQKITYSAGDSNELIRQFRNDKDFRIAVTCTLVATGTDVKPLEVVMFMRDVASAPLYTQMKGRGVRTIGDDQLRSVTPNAFSKDCFFLVDAVGVTEHDHVIPGQYEGPETETVTLRKLLDHIALGNLPDNYLKRLAATLSRLYNKADTAQREEFANLAHDDMQQIAQRIYAALAPEQSPQLPPFEDVNAPNLERKGLVAPLANHAEARKYILILAAGFVNTLVPGEDELISKGFSVEEAQSTTEAFEQYCRDHSDDIEALRILYNNEGTPITYQMLKDLEDKLKKANSRFEKRVLWNSYAIVCGDKVQRATKKQEAEALTNIIQLVRFAYRQTARLESACPTARQMFNLWYGQKQQNISPKQREVVSQVVDYIAANGACSVHEIKQVASDWANQLSAAFGGAHQANEALISVYNFVVLRKTA